MIHACSNCMISRTKTPGLGPWVVAALAQQMLQRLRQQDSEIKFKDTRIKKITFQLARLKASTSCFRKFGSAGQRQHGPGCSILCPDLIAPKVPVERAHRSLNRPRS